MNFIVNSLIFVATKQQQKYFSATCVTERQMTLHRQFKISKYKRCWTKLYWTTKSKKKIQNKKEKDNKISLNMTAFTSYTSFTHSLVRLTQEWDTIKHKLWRQSSLHLIVAFKTAITNYEKR